MEVNGRLVAIVSSGSSSPSGGFNKALTKSLKKEAEGEMEKAMAIENVENQGPPFQILQSKGNVKGTK